MAYKVDFIDNVAYGVDAVNNIRKSLTTSGVIFDTADSCKVVKAAERKVKISNGMAVANDGCFVEFYTPEGGSGGAEVNITQGSKNYVYLQRSPGLNDFMPAASVSMPSGDFVLLAEVAADGTITDMRSPCRARFGQYSVGKFYTVEDVTASSGTYTFIKKLNTAHPEAKFCTVYLSNMVRAGHLGTLEVTDQAAYMGIKVDSEFNLYARLSGSSTERTNTYTFLFEEAEQL